MWGVRDGLCVRENFSARCYTWLSVLEQLQGRGPGGDGGIGVVVVVRIVPDSKVLKTLSLTMVDKSDVLLMCGGEDLILLTVRQAGWGWAGGLLNAEHDPGGREAGGETERHSLLMLMGLALNAPELGGA